MGKLSFGSTGFAYSITERKFDQNDITKCARCNEKVFLIEQQKAAGSIWHKKCLTCGKCNKSLQTSNALSHQGNIYCSPCHKHVSAISGAIVPGQTPLSAGYTGLPVSGGDFRMRSNSVSSIPSESVRRSSVGVYSSRPARKVNFTAGIGVNDLCPACGNRVYFAEELKAHKLNWHKACFKCKSCNKSLTPGRSNEHEKNLFCQHCYSKLYGPKGYSSGGHSNLSTEDRITVEAKISKQSSESDETFIILRKNPTDTFKRQQHIEEFIEPNQNTESYLEAKHRLSNEPRIEENYMQSRPESIRECEEPIPNSPILNQYCSRENNNNKDIIYDSRRSSDNYSNSYIRDSYPIKEDKHISLNGENSSKGSTTRENYHHNRSTDEVFSPVTRRNLAYNDPLRRRSMPQESYAKDRRQSSTAAIRDDDIVFSIDQKIKPKHIIAKKIPISEEIKQNARDGVLVDRYQAKNINNNYGDELSMPAPVHVRYHSDGISSNNDYYTGDRRYGKDQESIDSGYGGIQQNKMNRFDELANIPPVMSRSFQFDSYENNGMTESGSQGHHNTDAIFQQMKISMNESQNKRSSSYNSIPQKTLWNRVASDIQTNTDRPYDIYD